MRTHGDAYESAEWRDHVAAQMAMERGDHPTTVPLTSELLTEDQRWRALKDHLTAQIAADLQVSRDFRSAGDERTASAYGAMSAAKRATLDKMQELEG